MAHCLSYLGYGKAVTLDGKLVRLVLGATTKLNFYRNCTFYVARLPSILAQSKSNL